MLPLDATESEIDEFRKKGYELWQVPMGYLSTFQKNLDEAICSIIGIATASSLKYISGIKINQTKTDTYSNPFVKDVIEVGNNPEKQKKKMMKLITQIDARMKSRFMRGTYLPTLNILASSKDTEQSFLEEYINITRKAKDTSTLVVDEPQWVVDERKDSPEKF